MRILGVDPGITGAIALLDHAFVFESVHDMPTMQRGVTTNKQMVNGAELARLVRELRPDCAVVELVNAMPGRGEAAGMGAASAFNFGDCAGCVRGVLGALGIPMHLVVPVVWKKRAGLVKSDKEASRSLAIRLWPQAPLGLKKYQGRAEALLIARYGLKEAPGRVFSDPFEMDADPKQASASDLRPGMLL